MKNKIKPTVAGVGFNDVDFPIMVNINGVRQRNPYYKSWHSMLIRCYNPSTQEKQVTYKGCTVCDDWLYLSNFKRWMEQQDWKGKQLDKDLLVGGNKVYSPETCLFITSPVNKVLTLRGRGRGSYPVGCHYSVRDSAYVAQCSDGKGGRLFLGRHKTPMEAHRAWQLAKIKVLDNLKDSQPDFLVKIGLQRIIDKIQDDYDNNRETIDFN